MMLLLSLLLLLCLLGGATTASAATTTTAAERQQHECRRECRAGEVSRVCYYRFKVEWYYVMSRACYDCGKGVASDCEREQCIAADGHPRPVVSVNRQLPGPAIEVCEGDQVVVDVVNHLPAEITTIHWHGQHQKGTPYMDGVPMLTQCGIPPHTTFRYDFVARNPGTHFWHSHLDMQRMDGAHGAFIVRQTPSRDPHAPLYDEDRHVVVLSDWTASVGIDKFTAHHHASGDNKPRSMLVNGKGLPLWRHASTTTSTTSTSTSTSTTSATTSTNPSTTTNEVTSTANETTGYASGTTGYANGTTGYASGTTGYTKGTTSSTPTSSTSTSYTNGTSDDASSGDAITMPVEVLEVRRGRKYRIRMVSNGLLTCPVSVSIDGHSLLVIAVDGNPVDPVAFESMVIYSGERVDFVLDASQPVGNYWLKIQGLLDCDSRFTSARQVAILRYEGAEKGAAPPPGDQKKEEKKVVPPTLFPEGATDYASMARRGKQLNPLNTATSDTLVSVVQLDAVAADDATSEPEPTHKFYVAFDFNLIDNPTFHDPRLYPIRSFPHSRRLYTPQLNHISLATAPAPPLSQMADIDPGVFCNETSLARRDCKAEFCECVHVLHVPLGAHVELVFVDEGYTFDASHPFHLHGYTFRVVAMERLGSNVSVAEVQRRDREGLIKRKLHHAVRKDTVTVPDGGYTIVRFVADNPGFWLLHCHIAFHMEIGMALILRVGELSDLPPVPANFPRCGNWAPAGLSPPSTDRAAATIGHNHALLFIIPLFIFLR